MKQTISNCSRRAAEPPRHAGKNAKAHDGFSPDITQETINRLFEAVDKDDVDRLAAFFGSFSKEDNMCSEFAIELLINACRDGKTAAARYLLEAGVHPDMENGFCVSPRAAAHQGGHPEIVALLADEKMHATKTHRQIQVTQPFKLKKRPVP